MNWLQRLYLRRYGYNALFHNPGFIAYLKGEGVNELSVGIGARKRLYEQFLYEERIHLLASGPEGARK